MDGVGDKHQSEEMWQHPAPRGKKASTPAERKQRRLESNRAAAKRAYYRRQDKVQTMRRENSLLRGAAVEHRFKIAIYESLLRRLGVDPEVAVEAIRGSAKPVHAAAAGQPSSAAAQEIGDASDCVYAGDCTVKAFTLPMHRQSHTSTREERMLPGTTACWPAV